MAIRVRPIPHADTQTVATLVAAPQVTVAQVPGEVVKITDGPVTLLQKIARYYKGLIVLIGTTLGLLTAPDIGALQHLLPAEYQHWLTIGIGALTAVLTILVENQHWFDQDTVGQPSA